MSNAPAVPRISVVIPSYNPGRYLAPAVNSVLGQLGRDDEVVVQDAESTDGTRELLRERSCADPRLRVTSEPDGGQSDALNRALGRVTGDYVIWLNADDVVIDGGIAAVQAAVRADPTVDLVVGAHRILREDGSVVDTFPGRELLVRDILRRGCVAFSGSIAMRTELLRAAGGFDPDLDTVMDLELQLRLAQSRPRQVVVDDPIGALRFHESSKSATLWPQFVRESHRVRMAYAHTGRDRLLSYGMTGLHIAYAVTFRIQLTAGYRRVRRLLARSIR
ncbi:glycosyltransferase [Williamsia sp. MIQD14]|uniref:glycosyltransferase n=1 Tax=Williamsia sp. MIQD14 TaxID=3425703 RepID=UPI003D9FF92B